MKRAAIFALSAALLGAAKAPDAGRWWSHVLFLADDKLEGRLTGSEGHRRAAEYVAAQFERSGLKPRIQMVKLQSRKIVESKSSVALLRYGKREPLVLGEEVIIGARSMPPPSLAAPMVFVGYGLVVPEKKYDDLAGLDLREKIAVYVSGGPASVSGPLRSHYLSAAVRAEQWRKAGVAGTVGLSNPRAAEIPWSRVAGARLLPAMALAGADASGRLTLTLNPAHAGKLLAGSGHTFDELIALAEAGKPLPTFPLPAAIEAQVEVETKDLESQNVVATLPGADPKLKREYVVLSAHLDHLGVGKPVNGDAIYNGAMDNASGVATLLDIAAALQDSGTKLRRSLIFVAVTGEEKGQLGSQYFAGNPGVPAKSIVADLNLDMFLPLYPLRLLTAIGAAESDLGDRLQAVAATLGVTVQNDQEPARNLFIRSDQYSFIKSGVPSLAFKVGYTKGSAEEATSKKWLAERYHAPSDDVNQPVDLKAAADFNQLLTRFTESIANETERPKWKKESFFSRFAK